MVARSKLIQLIAIAICLFVASIAPLQAEEKSNANPFYPNWGEMSPAMKKSMDPNVMNNMMQMMMDPEKMMSMESCAQCHEDEDIALYQKEYGPMMEAMKPMMGMMGPMMNPMMGMMGPMMNPMMGMMNPMMGMMNPMMGSGMMNPMMGMMNPMMGMMGPMSGGMGMPGMGAHGSNPMGQMMDPKQYEQWFNQWTESMKNNTPQPKN